MRPSKARLGVSIRRWSEIAENERLVAAIDAIFFEASGTKSFASTAERAAFRERWLGRYLAHDAHWAYLAFGPGGDVAGYLVGALADPAIDPRYSDIGYVNEFASITASYPAHLHVNLAPQYRNRGIGAALIAAFAADAQRAGAPGVHVVTGAASRNVAFYQRNGFRELGRAQCNGNEVVLLGRRLCASETA